MQNFKASLTKPDQRSTALTKFVQTPRQVRLFGVESLKGVNKNPEKTDA